MLKLGFDQRWVNIVMLCVSSVRYWVILNDYKIGPIIPGHGLSRAILHHPTCFCYVLRGLRL